MGIISVTHFFGNRWVRRCGWWPDHNLRLYRKDSGRFSERRVHEAVEVEGSRGYLKGPLEHRTYRDISDYLLRMDRYSTLAAREMMEGGRRAGLADITIRPVFTFLKMYILKRGFLDGAAGAVLSALYASYTLAKYSKLWEYQTNLKTGR